MKTARDLLGENLKALRIEGGMTQNELAEAADLSLKMIQKIEYGESAASPETIDKLAAALKCTPSQLFGGEGPKPIPPQWDPSPEELARILHYLRHVEPVTRLSALVMLTGLEEYSRQLRAIPGGAPFASVLAKLPRR
jgi:transcriptional regulator with XRE-family HTH domain